MHELSFETSLALATAILEKRGCLHWFLTSVQWVISPLSSRDIDVNEGKIGAKI